jgi:hypothetical protein
MAYMVNGFMAQFTKRVRPTGLAFLPAFRTSAKSILTMMGYIMKNRHTAIGMDTMGALPTYIARLSKYLDSSGANLPKTMPPTIQTATHKVRYFSKIRLSTS